MNATSVAEATTALFVPGDRTERFAKAAASGAAFVIIDLEDAVAPTKKAAARDAAFHTLSDVTSTFSVAVRLNALDAGGDEDLRMLSDLHLAAGRRLRAVVLAKAESGSDVGVVAEALPGTPIIPLVESAAGLASLDALAQAPQVVRLAFGALDFGVDVDATSPVMLNYARCALVFASRVAGLASPLDSPNPVFRDGDVVTRGAVTARALGFGGQLCIHPLQVPLVAEAFRPTSDEVAWARLVVATGDGGASQIGGAMVDRPVLLRASRILARSGA